MDCFNDICSGYCYIIEIKLLFKANNFVLI